MSVSLSSSSAQWPLAVWPYLTAAQKPGFSGTEARLFRKAGLLTSAVHCRSLGRKLFDRNSICLLYCRRPEMRHFVVAEVVRLRVELPASLRILTNPATLSIAAACGITCRIRYYHHRAHPGGLSAYAAVPLVQSPLNHWGRPGGGELR